MQYMVTDGLTVQEQIQAGNPRAARELVKQRLGRAGKTWFGELAVLEKLDPVTGNRARTQDFFGGQVITL